MRSPSPSFLLSFLFFFDSQISYVRARTTSFSPQDVAVVYSPQDAWREAGGETVRAIKEGAKLQVEFAGEQITLFGQTSSNVQYSINLDDQTFPSPSFSPSNSASPSRLFQASNLEANGEHRLELTVENGGTFVLNRIAVAFSSSNENTPALLPIDSTSTAASLTETSLDTSPSSGTNNSLGSQPASSTPSSSAAVVVGATLGSLAAFALLVTLLFWFCRRRRSSSSNDPNRNDSNYVNQETGNRRSFIPSAFQRRSSSVLPWSSTPRTPLSPSPIFLNPINGGIGSSPRQLPESLSNPSTPVIVGSETWQAKLTRAASWRRKVERLEETRKFYGVGKGGKGSNGNAPELRGPPPAVPLPRPPGTMGRDGPREMEERWRRGGEEPNLQARKQEERTRRRSY
ncbi:hypothetical protein JCM5353_000426, partial [Sporobolomyces roseus]